MIRNYHHLLLRLLSCILLIGGPCIIAAGRCSAANAESDIDTIAELWEGFDPHRDPLEIETVRTWMENEIQYESLYFTSETFNGEQVRVYALRGAPIQGDRLPGIVHMHGGGQTASLDWVEFWASRGYICVSFDWLGTHKDNKREHYTRWGQVRGNMLEVNPGLDMSPTPRSNTWYHWIIAGRRAITLLEDHPRADPDRIGFFGVSMGGFMTWNVAALDERVTAACALYGHGWDTYPVPPDLPVAPPDRDRLLYRELIQSDAYAPMVKCPILFLSASNDFCIGMDRAYDTLDLAVSAVRRQAFTPRYNHHLEPAEGRNLPLWMDWHLKGGPAFPATPGIVIAGDTIPIIRVAPEYPDKVEQVRIYYALNNPKPQSRYWRDGIDLRREGNVWTAQAPFNSLNDRIYAFANVTYRDQGPTLSSRMLDVPVSSMPGTSPTLEKTNMIDAMQDSSGWYYTTASTEPLHKEPYLIPWSGGGGDDGFTVNPAYFGDVIKVSLGTHRLGDPQWQGSGNRPLTVQMRASDGTSTSLTVKVIERHWQSDAMEYATSVSPVASNDKWHTYQITPADFKGSLRSWDEVNCLILEAETPKASPPVFRQLRWVSPDE